MRVSCIPLATCLLLVPCALAAASQSWELRDGRWAPVAAPTTAPTVTHDETLDQIEQLLAQRRAEDARKLGVEWIKTHKAKETPLRNRGLFLLAQAFSMEEDWFKAFYYFDELMDEYPESPFYYPALDRQYELADAFLNGRKRSFMGFRILSGEDEAVEMLYRIQQRSPGSPLAEKALLRTADYYYADTQYDLAADTYGVYARSYPRSPKVPRVRLRQAFSNYAQFRGLRFDATPLIDARAQLVEIAALYPDLAAEENLLPIIERIDHTFAKKVFVTADFYRRTSEPAAAVYNYRFLIATYPNSPDAARAKTALEKMPASALKSPPPAAGNGYGPTTQPVSEAR